MPGDSADGADGEPGGATAAALLADLDEATSGADQTVREEAEAIRAALARAAEQGLVDPGVRRLDARDAAEAFVGCVVFASPLLVEGGIFDIADYLFSTTVSGVPVFLLLNTAFVVLMTYALVEWTGQDKVEVTPLLNVVPGRVMMVLAVSFLVSTILLSLWGRVSWAAPTEALARITVLWAVGSLGAALGDILSSEDRPPVEAAPGAPGDVPSGETEQSAAAVLADLHERFERLESRVDPAMEAELDRIEADAESALTAGRFGVDIRKYTGRDIAEAFVGSVFFSIPFLVEDGVFEVAEYFLSVRVAGLPVILLANAAFVLAIVYALVYRTGPQDVIATRKLFGVLPRRLVGTAVVAFLAAAALMTMWGRVDGWADPEMAVARVSAVWTVAAFGAALGDILPGESSGDDINDDLADIGEQVEAFVEGLD